MPFDSNCKLTYDELTKLLDICDDVPVIPYSIIIDSKQTFFSQLSLIIQLKSQLEVIAESNFLVHHNVVKSQKLKAIIKDIALGTTQVYLEHIEPLIGKLLEHLLDHYPEKLVEDKRHPNNLKDYRLVQYFLILKLFVPNLAPALFGYRSEDLEKSQLLYNNKDLEKQVKKILDLENDGFVDTILRNINTINYNLDTLERKKSEAIKKDGLTSDEYDTAYKCSTQQIQDYMTCIGQKSKIESTKLLLLCPEHCGKILRWILHQSEPYNIATLILPNIFVEDENEIITMLEDSNVCFNFDERYKNTVTLFEDLHEITSKLRGYADDAQQQLGYVYDPGRSANDCKFNHELVKNFITKNRDSMYLNALYTIIKSNPVFNIHRHPLIDYVVGLERVGALSSTITELQECMLNAVRRETSKMKITKEFLKIYGRAPSHEEIVTIQNDRLNKISKSALVSEKPQAPSSFTQFFYSTKVIDLKEEINALKSATEAELRKIYDVNDYIF